MPPQKPGLSEQSVGTPPEFLIAVKRLLGIDRFAWDLAADSQNAVAEDFFAILDDALSKDWSDLPGYIWGWFWLNPPFADIEPWVKKAYEDSRNGAHVAALIPASVGANWWADWVQDKARIVPIQGRITFVGHTIGYPKDCALLLYGSDVQPGYASAWKWMDTLSDEEKAMAKKRVRQPKDGNVASDPHMGNVRPISAGRKKRRNVPPEDPKDLGATEAKADEPIPQIGLPHPIGRVTTFAPNGGGSMQPAPGPSSPSVFVPEPEAAQATLRELGILNDQALVAQREWTDLRDRAKLAKDRYDGLAAQVLSTLSRATHAPSMPLFDAVQREADQIQMEAAIEQVAEGLPDAAGDAQAVDLAVEGAAMPPPVEAVENPVESVDIF